MSSSIIDRTLDEQRSRVIESISVRPGAPTDRLDRLTALAQQMFGVSMVAVTLLDGNRQLFLAKKGIEVDSVPREVSFCDKAVRTPDEQLVLEDTALDAAWAQHPMVTGDPNVRFYAGQPIVVHGGPPLGTLCLIDSRPRAFTAVERELLRELAEAVEQELSRSDEMERAAQVQRSLLPPRPPTEPGWEFSSICLPSRAIGGDFLDWSRRPDGTLTFTLADVMGKGIGAGILAATVRASMRTAGRGLGVAEAVTRSAEALDDDLQRSGTLVTLLHAELEPTTGVFRWADVGHGLMLIVRADGTIEHPASDGLPMGVLSGDTWGASRTVLEVGDLVLAFSDGLLELYDGTLGAIAEIEAVVRATTGGPRALVKAFRELAGDAPLPDDLTISSLRRTAV